MEMVGSVRVVGVRGQAPIDEEFLHRLTDLPPTARHLALARACVAPWLEVATEEAPLCFERDHYMALYNRREEERRSGQAVFEPTSMFPSPEPVLKAFLLDLVGMTPARRRLHIALACTGAWQRFEDCPDWVRTEFHYACADHYEERFGARGVAPETPL